MIWCVMREIILIGYGNQGKAWAQNLRDSGWTVVVSGRPGSRGGKGISQARSDGFRTLELAEIAEKSSAPIALLLPDPEIPAIFNEYFAPVPRGKRAFIFAHGFAVTYGKLRFHDGDDVVLVAPKGIGVRLRELYQQGSGVMGVLGVAQDGSGQAWGVAEAVGAGLGCGRVGLVKSSFAEETNADLLSEQAILCGLLPRLIGACVEFLVKKGVNPKIAAFECLNETGLITDMMIRKGIEGMYRDVSPTAKFGGLRAADRMLPKAELDAKLEALWAEITSGQFAAELERDIAAGSPRVGEAMREFSGHIVDKNI